MLIHVSGAHDGEDWPQAGELVTVSDVEGADLVSNGYAEKAGKARGSSPAVEPDAQGTTPDDLPAAARKSSKA